MGLKQFALTTDLSLLKDWAWSPPQSGKGMFSHGFRMTTPALNPGFLCAHIPSPSSSGYMSVDGKLWFRCALPVFPEICCAVFHPVPSHVPPTARVSRSSCPQQSLYSLHLHHPGQTPSKQFKGGWVCSCSQSIRVAGAVLSLWQELATCFEHIPQEQRVEILGQRWG